jgi:hypothetical protein
MLAEIRTELMKLAADLVLGEGIPSDFDEDHPPRRTRHYWLAQLERAHSASKSKGMRLKAIFEKLAQLERAELETPPECSECHNQRAVLVDGVSMPCPYCCCSDCGIAPGGKHSPVCNAQNRGVNDAK